MNDKTMREAAFWFAVVLVSIASSVGIKVIAAKTPWKGFQELAGNA